MWESHLASMYVNGGSGLITMGSVSNMTVIQCVKSSKYGDGLKLLTLQLDRSGRHLRIDSELSNAVTIKTVLTKTIDLSTSYLSYSVALRLPLCFSTS